MFEACHTRALEERGEFLEVFFSPLAAQAWAVSELHAAGLSGGGVDAVSAFVDTSAGEEAVTSHLNTSGVCIID